MSGPFSAYIVLGVRTGGGKKGGSLSQVHPCDLGAIVVDELLARTGIDPAAVDDVIFGCVDQSKVLPLSVPGTTVDRQCGSSQQALHFAAQAVMSGTQDVVIAGGVEVMSLVPIGANVTKVTGDLGFPKGAQMEAKWPGIMFTQYEGAEILAKKHNVTREDMEEFAVLSHTRAFHASKKGVFKNEIVPVKVVDSKGEQKIFDYDEGIRYPVDSNKLKSLPLLKPNGGRLTAATASQITDGASAILICNERGLQRFGLKPLAKIHTLAVVGSDPVEMLGGPIPATQLALKKANLTIDQIDLYEVNEAFAVVPLAWKKVLGADMNKLNVNGGAMALGHPLGATGTKLMTTLVNEMLRRGSKYGLLAICEGGGTANATIIERVQNAKL